MAMSCFSGILAEPSVGWTRWAPGFVPPNTRLKLAAPVLNSHGDALASGVVEFRL